MAEAIRMPLLSDTMTEGIIASWLKNVGDKVKSDDVIAEVETDKATMEVLPYVEGTLLYIGVEKGKAAKVNDIIAIIGKEGEDFSAILEAENKSTGSATQTAPATTAPATPANEKSPAAHAPSGDATVIRMPLLSDTMKEGKIVAWHKKVGETVKSDDALADVETDKATMEVLPYVDGTLLYIGVKENEAAKVNDIIAIVGKPGTDIQPYLANEGSAEPSAGEPPKEKESAPPAERAAAPVSGENTERVKASPLAKKIAREKGIDLHGISGSGDGGRIIRRDLDNIQPGSAKPQASAISATADASVLPAGTAEEGYTDISLSQMRKTIARRLSESKFTAPHFYLRMTIRMDEAMAARSAINNISPVKVSFNDLIVKAVAAALRKHPEVNSSWTQDAIRQYHHIHIGNAVAVDEGLIVPVIRFADLKSLSQIAAESKLLAEKARSKKLQPQEFTGNTFTISNLGMMDIDEFTAIINPPDSCILAVGKISPEAVVENGEIVVQHLLKLTLSCDHRVVDGAVGARFLQTLKAFLENPVTILV